MLNRGESEEWAVWHVMLDRAENIQIFTINKTSLKKKVDAGTIRVVAYCSA